MAHMTFYIFEIQLYHGLIPMPKLPGPAYQKPDSAALKAVKSGLMILQYMICMILLSFDQGSDSSITSSASSDPLRSTNDTITVEHAATKPIEQPIGEKAHKAQRNQADKDPIRAKE